MPWRCGDIALLTDILILQRKQCLTWKYSRARCDRCRLSRECSNSRVWIAGGRYVCQHRQDVVTRDKEKCRVDRVGAGWKMVERAG